MKKLWRDCKKFAFCYDVDNKNKHVIHVHLVFCHFKFVIVLITTVLNGFET